MAHRPARGARGVTQAPTPQDRLNRARAVRAAAGQRGIGLFDRVRRFCLFVGQSRSGHSVLGTLLNAHQQAVVSHNLDALDYLAAGVGREDLLLLILDRDRWLGERGRKIGGHSYDIPELWQGDHADIRVIGDKRAGATSRHLARHPGLLGELPARLGLDVCAIHHVRNPIDNISSIWTRKTLGVERSLDEAADHYFAMLEGATAGLRAAGAAVQWIRTYHEDLIRDPRSTLRPVFELLDLPLDDYFLRRCEAFIHHAPRQTRHLAPWTPELERSVSMRAAAFDFLERYSKEQR